MAEKTQSSGGGIGFFGLLTILFIALKLTGVIDWSWLWVLAPLWIPFTIAIVIVLIVFVIILIRETTREVEFNRKNRR